MTATSWQEQIACQVVAVRSAARVEGAPLSELASGIDALYLSARAVLPSSLLRTLREHREKAEIAGAAVPIELAGHAYELEPRPFGRYRFRLRHDHGLIGVMDGDSPLPAIRFQPLSEWLHGLGPSAVAQHCESFAVTLCGRAEVAVSRLDLYSDWHGWNLEGDDRHNFLCRAKVRRTNEEDDAFTGFEFGRRTSGTVNARIYDKTLDVRRKATHWWYAVWGDRFEPGRQVLRVEFELARELLRDFGEVSPAAVLERVGDYWNYATHAWLTHRTPTSDGTKSRWPVSASWQNVQAATLVGTSIGLERTRALATAGELWRLLPGLSGYLSSYAALKGCESIWEVLNELPADVEEHARWSGVPFEERIRDKRRKAA